MLITSQSKKFIVYIFITFILMQKLSSALRHGYYNTNIHLLNRILKIHEYFFQKTTLIFVFLFIFSQTSRKTHQKLTLICHLPRKTSKKWSFLHQFMNFCNTSI